MIYKIKKWWIGEEYHVQDVFPGIRYKRHWTSKTAHTFLTFYLNHWMWVWSTTIAVCALIIAYLKLP